MFDYDLVVIGSGSAGFVAAKEARLLHFKVLVVEKNLVGGECTNTGCVPSKTLIRIAKIAHQTRNSEACGLPRYVSDEVNLKSVMEYVRKIVFEVRQGEQDALKKGDIQLLFGSPTFLDKNTIELNGQKISSRFFLIATGSRPDIPDIKGLEETGFRTNNTLFDLDALPKTFIFIGGGPIAMEMAQAFHRLGSQVIVLQRGERILPKDDTELTDELTEIFMQEGIQIHTGAKPLKIERSGDRKRVSFEHNGERKTAEGDEILIASGRKPNIEGLNLERIGGKFNEHGIVVDGHFRTSVKNIYACGDVVGPYLFTHMAGYQARIAVYHALASLPVSANYRVVPWATFTDPELARVGLTEEEAGNRHGMNRIRIYRFPFQKIDRAKTDNEQKGKIKLITDSKNRILGAHILGHNAGEMIHEFILAMELGIPADKLSRTMHIYPTYSLGVWQSTEEAFQESMNSSSLVRAFRLLAPKPQSR